MNVEFEITAPDRVPLLVLLALLASFGFIRMSTRLMRSPKVPWWPGSIKSGDLHIHHLVFGIVLVLVCGFLAFAVDLRSPWIEIVAVGFGIGAGLTLDEYALWLHLEDVYWAEEGRSSVDATIIAAVFAGLVITINPFSNTDGLSVALISAAISTLVISAIAVSKGSSSWGSSAFSCPVSPKPARSDWRARHRSARASATNPAVRRCARRPLERRSWVRGAIACAI